MSDIPQALVEKGVGALYEHVEFSSQEGTAPLVRAILAAVWPDLPAARPVVDRDALTEALAGVQHQDYRAPRRYAEALADAVLAVVQDAADVRREVAEECIAAIAATSAVFASDAMRVIARNAGLMP